MTTVAILPLPTEKGGVAYRGMARDKRSQGSTVGEALDALTTQLPDEKTSLLVVVQNLRPDRFFDFVQQCRLGELMDALRLARDAGVSLPSDEQAELDALIEAELYTSANRAAMLADEAGRRSRAMNPHHPQVAARAEYRCKYCHARETVSNFSFKVDPSPVDAPRSLSVAPYCFPATS